MRCFRGLYEAERHRPAPRLLASFSRAAPRVQLLHQYQDKYARIGKLWAFTNQFSLTLGEKSVGHPKLCAFTKNYLINSILDQKTREGPAYGVLLHMFLELARQM